MKTKMENYNNLIDPETWAFIEQTELWYPPETIDFSIIQQREIYNTMCREFYRGYAAGIVAADFYVSGNEQDGDPSHPVPVRHYSKKEGRGAAAVVYLHGGGFVVGGLDSHDDVCGEICDASGFDVYSVDYRLSPEHLHPAAFDDALAVTEFVARKRSLPIVLCGDSAGGNLAAAVAHRLRGDDIEFDIAGQMLIYPGLGGDTNSGSYVTHAEAPMLSARDVQFYSGVRSAGEVISGDPSFAPLHDTDFSDLPPTIIVSAQCDPLSDDGRHYSDAINNAGGRSVWINETGLVHGFLRARSTVGRARQSFTRILEGISMLGQRQWHY